jgi:hypothetical protein
MRRATDGFRRMCKEYDRSSDILVRFDRVSKLLADRNVRAPITRVAPEEAVGTPFGLQTRASAISLPAT